MIRRAILAFALAAAACGGGTPPPKTNVESAPPASMATRFANNDVVAYVVKTSDGHAIGRAHSIYLDAGDGLPKIRTRIAVDPGAAKGSPGSTARSMELVTTLNTDLTPQAYKELHSVDGRLELRFKDQMVTVLTDNGVRDVPYKRTAGAVLAPKGDLLVLALALERANLAPGSTAKLSLISPKNPAVAEPVSLTVYNDADGSVVAQSAQGKVTLDKSGRITRFEDPDTGWIFEREQPPGDAPKIEPPADPSKYIRPASAEWSDRDVIIDVKDGQLAGTLSEPRLHGDRVRMPGIVFISDMGPQDRYGFGGAVDAGTWQILDHLVDIGYAVLRIDDRGTGKSTSTTPLEDLGLQAMVDDAAACVTFLRNQPAVDPERIFVIGHGVGGVAALLLAGTPTLDLAGLILVSTPYRNLPELLAAEQAAMNGGDREKIERDMRLAVSALEGNAAARAQVGPQRIAELAAIHKLYTESAKLDLAKTLAKLKLDVAVFQGMKDFEVSWRDDAKPMMDAFKKAGNKKTKLYAYENVDHLMKSEPAQSSPRRYADKSRRIEPQFLEDLGTWLKSIKGPAHKAP